jgi:hypothetical protein
MPEKRELSTMTSRFLAPWRIAEIGHEFAVDAASGQQLGIFHGRDDSNTAGHTSFLAIDEARQMTVDFARLPEFAQVDCRSLGEDISCHRGSR